MHTDTLENKKPTGSANNPAGHTDSVIIASAEKTGNTDKVFCSLRAAFALRGHSLHRTDPNDGVVTYWAERWGLVRYLPTIDTVRQFLEQIGGRL
ncbi:MAG: hypothetical protein P4L96_12365 [Rhodoferax sp.]|nr:hypothetical protein [Rhodoferax sp.]